MIQETVVSIIGVGGTGSAVAVQLARLGVKELRIVDKDKIELSNLNRLYGSTYRDIGKWKVNALKEHISHFSRSVVDPIVADITNKDIVSILADSDVIFGCTDNLSSRAVLNDLAIQYYIPLIDVGCRIDVREDRSVNQAVGKVQVVTPEGACLWCTGALEGKAILQESFSEEEKEKLSKEGYYQGIEKQPAIVSLTTLAATIAVNKFLSLLGVFGEDYATRNQIELKDEFLIADSPEIRLDCVCNKRRGLGEIRRILFVNKERST